MSRLIDGDALKQEFMYIDDIPAVTEHDIDNAPTIPAIPVEWLREKMQKPLMTSSNPFVYVMAEWDKEQEAR